MYVPEFGVHLKVHLKDEPPQPSVYLKDYFFVIKNIIYLHYMYFMFPNDDFPYKTNIK